MIWKGTRRFGGWQSNRLAGVEVHHFMIVMPQAVPGRPLFHVSTRLSGLLGYVGFLVEVPLTSMLLEVLLLLGSILSLNQYSASLAQYGGVPA